MRKIIFLSILSLFIGCTVVPDPTAAGVSVTTTDSSIVGSWIATSTAATNSGTVVVTSTYSHQMTITNSPRRFQRWVFDSTPGTNSHPALIENGTWSVYTSNDTTRVVLSPNFRQLATVGVGTNFPDTVAWRVTSSTLHWVGPHWNRTTAIDSLKETLDWSRAN